METEMTEQESEKESESNVKNRLLLPVLIPIVAVLLVALLGISFSRIFLAGAGGGEEAAAEAVEHSKSSAPVMWATIVTIVVLLGAAGISLMRMRSTSFKLIVSGVIVVVILSGAVLFSAGEMGEATLEYGQPTPEEQASADPNNFVDIDALPSLTFQATEFSAKAGVVRMNYIGKGGAHQLRFKDSRLNWFDLTVNDTQTASGDVVLEPGAYVVFCPIPGHENMNATLTVQ